MTPPKTSRLLAFAAQLQRAETFEQLLVAAREEVERVVGYAHAWLFVADSEDADEWRLIEYAGVQRGVVWSEYPVLRIRGDAMLEEIARSLEPVVVADARVDPRTDKKIVLHLGNRTIVNVPLRLLDKPFGAFGTGTFGDIEGCRPPSPEELDYLVGMSTQLSVAAGRIRFHEERRRVAESLRQREEELAATRRAIEQGAARLQVLVESSREFALAGANLEHLLQVVANRLSERIGELCAVRLLSRDGELLEGASAIHHPNPEFVALGKTLTVKQRLGEGISGTVAATGEPILLPSIRTPDFVAASPPSLREAVARLSVTSLLSVPIKANLRVLGVITMTRSDPSNPYSEDDLFLAQDLADRAALAIENATLLSDLEARVAERTAALEEANRELEAFSYSVAHDLRAPLRGISGFAGALLEDHGGRLDEHGRSLLRRVTSAAGRMGDMIDAILGLARVSRAAVRREPIDLTRLAGVVFEQLQASDARRAVAFSAEEGLLADGDPQLVRTVLENLLGNAWKFTAKEAHARIEFGREVTARGPAFYVRDNGAGFDMALAGKLFATFARLHTPQEFEGTGIGLATVQRIVRRHGGRIWAEGAVGRGATFHFTLGSAAPVGSLVPSGGGA